MINAAARQPATWFGLPTDAASNSKSAATMLTVYLVVLLGIPSNVVISPLGQYGRPSLICGLVLLAWWILARLQDRFDDRQMIWQPVRHTYGILLVVALISFSMAMFRGQPVDQISPAVAALLRLAAWAGVLLICLDGVRTREAVTALARRLAIAGAILAALGLAQSITHQTLLGWFGAIPGLSYGGDEIVARGDFVRASGTAIHPLEFAVSIIGMLPFALGAAATRGFRFDEGRKWLWWILPLLIMVTSLVAVSRSAIIGLLIALVGSMSFLPKRLRLAVLGLGAVAIVAIAVLVPGMLTTTIYLFTGASDDPSTQSRADGLSRVPGFLAASPLFGAGFGTFLPRYYIFDNQFALLLVELGILGTVAFVAVIVSALTSTLRAASVSRHPDTVRLARMFAISLVSITVLYAFFDALSFPIAAGLFFLIIGLCASMRNVAATETRLVVDASEQPPPKH